MEDAKTAALSDESDEDGNASRARPPAMNRKYLLALSLSLVAIISAPLSGTQQQQQKGTAPGASSTPPSQPAAPPPAGTAAPDSAAPTAASAAPAKPAAPLTPQAQALIFYRTGKFDAAIDAYTKLASADPGAAYAGLTRVYLQQKRTTDAYAAVNIFLGIPMTMRRIALT
jgi:tetratricopeptide (TPR) repeat protein